MVLQLLAFHVYLVQHRLTTYEYIVREQSKPERTSEVKPWSSGARRETSSVTSSVVMQDGDGASNAALEVAERVPLTPFAAAPAAAEGVRQSEAPRPGAAHVELAQPAGAPATDGSRDAMSAAV